MDGLTKFAIRLTNNKKGYKEELRLLYVALTRAKNKLFITGTISNTDLSEINKTSYTNMLLSCFADEIVDEKLEKENFILEFVDELDEIKISKAINEQDIQVFGEDFVYPCEHKFNIPLKNTVTGINSELSQSSGFKIKSVIDKTTQYEVEDKAKIGTLYHKVLEDLDLTSEYFENKQYKEIDYSKIKLAHEKLSPMVKDAVSIQKEADFMMYVPYNKIVGGDVEDKVLVQGVVDLIIEKEDSVVIVDYKFSKLPAKVLKEKYAEQLNLYKLAVESAYNKTVEQMFIYSINTGELA
jgi:ATP-dependent helicase/nuclease subunit A